MSKIYAHHPDGVVREITPELPDDIVPGRDIYPPEYAADLTEVTKLKPRPDVGWITADKGKTFAPPAEPQAPPVTTLGFLSFLALFTSAEQGAIISSGDPQIKLFCLMAAGATVVDLADLRTVAGVQQLETLGLIGKGRAKQVLAGKPAAA